MLIYKECNLQYNDYIYDLRHYVKDNRINYQDSYSRQCSNISLLNYDIFKKFINDIQYNLPHEEELKYVFNSLCEGNLMNQMNRNNYLSQQELFKLFEMEDEKEEDFIKKGKVIKDASTKTNWKKNIKRFTDGEEGTRELFKKNYIQLEKYFYQINDNCIRYGIENLIDYFDNSNEEISEEGDILKDRFKSLMNNIGITENLNLENVINLFSHNNKGPKKYFFKLSEFLSIYYCFIDDRKKKGMNINKTENQIKDEISTTKKKKGNYIYKNAHRNFTQQDIDHLSELCNFVADIIIDEKNMSISNYFKNTDNYSKGFITMEKLKKVFRDDLDIDIDSDNSMDDFFDMVIADDKIEGKDIVKINHIINVIKTYSGKDKPNIGNQTNKQSTINQNTMNNNNTINTNNNNNTINTNNNNTNTQFQFQNITGDNAVMDNNKSNLNTLKNQNQSQINNRFNSSINDNNKNINIDNNDATGKILKNFSQTLFNNKIPFNSIFPSDNNNANQTISYQELERGIQKTNYPLTKQELNILINHFDPISKNKIEVEKLKNDIKKYEPTYFNESFNNPNQTNLKTLNTIIQPKIENNVDDCIEKIKNYFDKNDYHPYEFFKKIFNKDNEEKIPKNQFIRILKKPNPYPAIENLKEEEIEQFFNLIDKDKDEHIEINELLTYFQDDDIQLNQTIVKDIDTLFNKVDSDKKNKISVEEFLKCLKSVNYQATKKTAEKIIQKYDNNDNKITRENFKKAIGNEIKKQLRKKIHETEYIKQLFRNADIDKNGYLTEKQLKFLIKTKLQTNLSEEEINIICKKASEKYDGIIDIDEFVNLLNSINKQNLNESDMNNSLMNEALQNMSLNLNSLQNIQPNTFISLYDNLPLSFIPSFIRQEQKLLKLLPSSVLKPQTKNNGIIYEDILSNSNQGEKFLKEINTKVNSKISFINYATGVPSPDEKLFNSENKLKIVGRILKIALFKNDRERKKEFIGNAISIDCKYKKEYSDRWYFEDNRQLYNNNIIIRYDNNDLYDIHVIFEFVLVIQKKVDNVSYTFESSCGFSQIPLIECNAKKDVKLDIQGGSPFEIEAIDPKDILTTRIGFIPKLTSLFSDVKPLLNIRIKPFTALNKKDQKYINYLPKIIVCHRAALIILSEYRKKIGKIILNNPDYLIKPIKIENPIFNSFYSIVDCPDAFRMMVELFNEIIVNSNQFKEFDYSIKFDEFVGKIGTVLSVKDFKFDSLDPTKVPRGSIDDMTNRSELINSIIRSSYDNFNPLKYNKEKILKEKKFEPFSVDNMINDKINITNKLEKIIGLYNFGTFNTTNNFNQQTNSIIQTNVNPNQGNNLNQN